MFLFQEEEESQSSLSPFFHHRPHQKDIIISILINIIMDFTLVPTMKPFTVINSPETDSRNMIHCCTIRSLFSTSALTSWQYHNLMVSHNLPHTERWTSSDAPELQNLRRRWLDASGAVTCTQAHTTTASSQILSFSQCFHQEEQGRGEMIAVH